MIVVMPNGHTQNAAAPGESSREYIPMMGGGPRQAVASMEESFGDIIKFVESNYRVKKGKGYRAVAGLSMGGMHSASISAQYTNTFDYVGIFSAPPIPALLSTDNNPDASQWLMSLLINLRYNKEWFQALLIACGKTDFLYQGVLESMNRMDKIGFKYIYRESEGGHIWRN